MVAIARQPTSHSARAAPHGTWHVNHEVIVQQVVARIKKRRRRNRSEGSAGVPRVRGQNYPDIQAARDREPSEITAATRADKAHALRRARRSQWTATVIPVRTKGATKNRVALPPHPGLCGTTMIRNSQMGTAAHKSSNELKLS